MAGIHNILIGAASGFVFTLTIASPVTNFHLSTAAIAGGWNGTQPLIAIITNNSWISTTAGGATQVAFDTASSYPVGSRLILVNNGYIVGRGGQGGNGASMSAAGNGQWGDHALRVYLPTDLTNNGLIGGGGGGGGGGGANYAPGSKSDPAVNSGGGGGGGGRSNVSAHAPGGGPGTGGGYGGTGTQDGPGAGAAGRYFNMYIIGGTGGNGGGWGGSGNAGGAAYFHGGGAGTTFYPPGAGGPAGYCIINNSYINWIATGTRYGLIL